ncbi:hypothetical protein KKB55_09670, partial [Myxococcota bacterium]|nr:hypothetical protein [Myxococcota bacterium]
MHLKRWAALALMTLFAAPLYAQVQIAAPPAESPYTLTAADGTGLALVGLRAKAIVDGPLAFTELHLTFQNPHPRQIEGHFKITMPEHAAISRFAMMIRGGWMEGEVVEKQAARRAYEDALHRRQDPALLEQDSGNSFRARVFPIGPNERKEIIISWSQELLSAGEAYRLPLNGLPKIELLELTAMTTAKATQGPKSSLGGETSRYQITKVEKRDFAPDQDWIIYGGEVPASGDALRHEDLGMVRFTVPPMNPNGALSKEPEIAFNHATLLFDTSASRAINFEARLTALSNFVAGLAGVGVTTVEVIAFDQSSEVVFQGAPAALPAEVISRLKARGALGASSLTVGLTAAAATQGADRRLILFTDGMVTAGEADSERLKGQMSALALAGFQRADVVVDTTARDGLVLDALVTSALPHAGKVVEGQAPLAEQLDRLRRATSGRVLFEVPGAKWIWPSEAKGLQGGDLITVFADLPAGAPLSLKITGLAQPVVVTPAARDAEQQLLHRAWVAARIQRLLKMESQSDPDMRGALKQQIITLSTKHRVLSPYTALVVLETEYDYQRFGIQRNALADILTIGINGLEVLRRTQPYVAPPPPPKTVPIAREERRTRKGGAKKMAKRRARIARDDDDRETAKAAEAPEMKDEVDDLAANMGSA